MINSNLAYLLQFLQRKELKLAKELMKIRSAELQAVVSSAGTRTNSEDLEEISVCVSSKLIRRLPTESKILLAYLLRLLALEDSPERSWFAVLQIDLESFYTKIGIKQNREYFYLSTLSDNQYCYKFDEDLSINRRRTNLFRRLQNPIKNRREEIIFDNIFEVLYQLIRTSYVKILYKNRPKKKVYRKGYNDHGSLGSEFSKTLRQQSSDWSLNELERKRQKEISDSLNLLLGLDGWI